MSRKGRTRTRVEVIADFRWPAANEEEWVCLWPRQCLSVHCSRRIVGGVAEPWSIHVSGTHDNALHRVDLTEDEARAILRALPNPLSRAWLIERGFTTW